MDQNIVMADVIEEESTEFAVAQVSELTDLQLAYVGGGIGSTII